MVTALNIAQLMFAFLSRNENLIAFIAVGKNVEQNSPVAPIFVVVIVSRFIYFSPTLPSMQQNWSRNRMTQRTRNCSAKSSNTAKSYRCSPACLLINELFCSSEHARTFCLFVLCSQGYHNTMRKRGGGV